MEKVVFTQSSLLGVQVHRAVMSRLAAEAWPVCWKGPQVLDPEACASLTWRSLMASSGQTSGPAPVRPGTTL